MCGIAGFLDPLTTDDAARASVLSEMLARIAHRGPDDAGQWLEGPLALGHRRLSIVDLSLLGHQPMQSGPGRFVIALNGEIYNHSDLRRQLEGDGIVFRGHSDTEVLLALIEAHGVARALEACVGMFAIALWDRHESCLFLARDRFGEKPLYVSRQGRVIVFASELKALVAHPAFVRSVDPHAVREVLRQGFVTGGRSIYENVQQVLPGTFVRITDHQSSFDVKECVRFWDSAAERATGAEQPFVGSFVEAVATLEDRLRAAVRLQLQADVPVGALLSGGVDSSLVTALMQAESGGKVRSYSIGFHGDQFNEADHANSVAAYLGTSHTEWYVDETEALALVPELAHLYDEPLADSSQIPTVVLAKLVRRDVTVALSGDGADELFGGYPKFLRGARISKTYGRTALAVALNTTRHLTDSLRPVLPRAIEGRIPWHRLRTAAALYGARPWLNLARSVGNLNHEPEAYMASDIVAELQDQDVDGLDRQSYLRLAMLNDTLHYLPNDILVKVDRATMAASLESRAPFLDHRVYRFAAALPDSYLFDRSGGKRLLREVLFRLIPRSMVDRPKTGFSPPIGRWLRGRLRSWAYDVLADPAAARLLDVRQCRSLLDLHTAGRFDMSARLWPILTLAAWARVWRPA